ncbi:PREDICTED: protein FAM3B [Nanorana parkeri]|uniref:protein FAM3B n=1 Tax=Nanorana parkeri TaxID=125878 RepID=UPI000854F07F|nr:PREDICTED: protein FAM3B [Nanorana parkeri]
MVNFRFLSTTTVKVIGLLCASVCAWYLGYFFAEILPEDSLQTAIGSVQRLGEKPVIKAPPPLKQKCAVWRNCQPSEVVFRIRCGGSKDILPDICLDGEMLLGGSQKTGNRGLNFVIVNPTTLKVIDTKTFDMYEGDFSGPMVEFMNKIPAESIILVASHDDASTKLNDAAKKAFEDLGSKEIRNVRFRSGFVFLAVKGATIPDYIEREKIIHSEDTRNRYSGWPAEIQIDGCLPRK